MGKRILRAIFIGAIVSLGMMAAQAPTASAATSLLSETFTGNSTAPGVWTYGGNGSSTACLTAGNNTTPAGSVPACDPSNPPDSTGDGVLRLTNNTRSQAGFVILNTPLNSSQGFSVKFDMYQYGGSGADGIGFALIDGSYSPTTHGGAGGSLGYGKNTLLEASGTRDTRGIEGGYMGVGFDVFGNFPVTHCSGANPSGPTCAGFLPNSVSVRGAHTADYDLVTSKVAAGNIGIQANDRAAARRTVTINVSPTQHMTVFVDYHDGNGAIVELSNVDITAVGDSSSPYPSTFKIGFTGSTGGQTNYHEIRNLSIETLGPDLTISVTPRVPTITSGAQAIFDAIVTNEPVAVSTLGDITSTFTLPSGFTQTSAGGDGWNCTLSGQTVTCTRPGSGANALQAGESAPTIVITANTDGTIPVGDYTINASVSTLADTNSLNDADTATISVITPIDPPTPTPEPTPPIVEEEDPEPIAPVTPRTPDTGAQPITLGVGVAALIATVALAGIILTARHLSHSKK